MLTNKDYLNLIVRYLNSVTNKEYKMKVFVLPINYKAVGNIGTITREEGIIAIVSKYFDENCLDERIIGEPEYFKNFYETGDFIFCFGPYENTMDLIKTLNAKADIKNFYGFDKFYERFLLSNELVRKYKINNNN